LGGNIQPGALIATISTQFRVEDSSLPRRLKNQFTAEIAENAEWPMRTAVRNGHLLCAPSLRNLRNLRREISFFLGCQSFSLTPLTRYSNQVSIRYFSLINDLGGFADRQGVKSMLGSYEAVARIKRRAHEPR